MIEEKDILLTDGEDDPVFEGIYIKTKKQQELKQEILENQEIRKRLEELQKENPDQQKFMNEALGVTIEDSVEPVYGIPDVELIIRCANREVALNYFCKAEKAMKCIDELEEILRGK